LLREVGGEAVAFAAVELRQPGLHPSRNPLEHSGDAGMSLGHLDTLQLDRDTVADTHNFLVGYAEMCMRESGDLPQDEHLKDRQRVWARRVEAATSYFEAGQWAMITNPEEAIRLGAKQAGCTASWTSASAITCG